MLPQLDPTQLIPIYLTTQTNTERLAAMPPLMARSYEDPIDQADARLSAADAARLWDIYRDVVQVSFRWQDRNYHFMLCAGNEPVGIALQNDLVRFVYTVHSEEMLIRSVFAFLEEALGIDAKGNAWYERKLVGWHTHQQVWPVLLTRALKYRVRVPRPLMADPERKWPVSQGLIDLALLCGAGSMRFTPGLADALRYWGFGEEALHPMPNDIADAVCDDPLGTAIKIEPYLRDMLNVALTYYDVKAPVVTALTGRPVGPVPIP